MYAGAYLEMSKSKYVKEFFKFLGCEINVKDKFVVTHDGKRVKFSEPIE